MQPINIKKGDTIAIIAPAKAIEKEYIDFAIQIIEENGYRPIVSKHCLGKYNYFSGTIEERTKDLQWAIENEDVKAILCARGGYGCIQIIDKVDWVKFLLKPKWLIGFSDVTVFHQYLSTKKIRSLHATMPLNFKSNSDLSLSNLFEIIEKGKISYSWSTEVNNIVRDEWVSGEIIGGNLTVLCGMIGTKYQPNYENKILFIEDIGEHLYGIDRSFHQLANSDVLNQIKGLIVGDFSNIKDTTPPFGLDLQDLIKSHFSKNTIPIAFDFPAGHCDDNQPLIFGKTATLKVCTNTSYLRF